MNPPPVAPVIRACSLRVPPDHAFRVFTEEIGAWWPLPTHGTFGEAAGSVAFVDGRLVEQSADGREAEWGRVLAWEPPSRLVFTWHPGTTADDASEVEVRFEPDPHGTRVVLEHRCWESFGERALERRRHYVGPGAWGHVLDHLADAVELRDDAPDLAALLAAYDEFFAEAELGGFGAPPDGEFDAEQVLAHVALNDAAMIAVCHALVHGREPRFENERCHDRDALTRWIGQGGGPLTLVERGRARSVQVAGALARLSSEQRSTLVHCRLLHDGDVMVDQPMPWEVVAIGIQADRHLPAHVDQLRNLRTT